MKIRPVGDEMLLMDRHTDMAKLTVAFRNFANAPKMGQMMTEIQHKSFTNLIQHNALIEKLTVACLIKTFPDFTEPKGSIPLFAAWTMHCQIITKERPTKCNFQSKPYI
jgi:hypothetical protein